MSVQITTAFVRQYHSNVVHLSQQKGSRLRMGVRVEMVNGKSAFFDQIAATAARKRTSRHADTPRMDTPHKRRRVTLDDFDWADLVDSEDKIRMLNDPASEYAEAAAMAMGRSIDDAIIEAADATSYTGEDGATSTAFDTNMVVDVQTVWDGASAADCGLNVAKILAAAEKLLAEYIALGGSLAPDPDPQSPFYDPDEPPPPGPKLRLVNGKWEVESL